MVSCIFTMMMSFDCFFALLDNAKFRRVFSDKYPLILIDEYQDSLKPIIDRFLEYFISRNSGPQFGFFGDSWQTIYQSNKACGLIQHENIVEIKKGRISVLHLKL